MDSANLITTPGTPRGASGPRTRRARPSSWRIFWTATRAGFADYKSNYSVKSWTFGWLSRCLMEVAFFGLIGILLQSREVMFYLLIGRGLFLGVSEVMWVIQSTAWERGTGTLPLLVSSPGRVWPVFAGRSLQWIPSSCLTSLVALLALAPLFGVRYEWTQALVIVVSVIVSVIASYGFALPLAALVLKAPHLRNLASNIAHAIMGLVCGVLVPVAFWPLPIQWFASIFPVTHSLSALRSAMEVSSPGAVLAAAAPGLITALILGAFWMVVGALLLERFAEQARRNGSIDLDG